MNITWDSKGYTENFSFVHAYGEDVLNLLSAPLGSYVIDLGCGNGALTEKLAAKGYRVLGADASDAMLETARALHPDLTFVKADATTLSLPEKADAIFSNAVFHWIDADKQPLLLSSVANQLKPGGQLVCEFGGYGCAEKVHSTLEQIFARRSLSYRRTFYFPTIGEYAPMMEQAGLRVTFATLFDRPTPQKGEDGLASWIRMFDKAPFEGMTRETADEIIAEAVEALRPELCMDGVWIVDYVRIRLKAIRV